MISRLFPPERDSRRERAATEIFFVCVFSMAVECHLLLDEV